MEKKIKAYVINHGHMDIEWYQPLTTFGTWFADCITMLADIADKEEDYACYVYDGMVFPVLYALKEGMVSLDCVKKLITDGKLKIGPFYTQYDEFLTSGEGIIRNCLIGDRKCRELGAEPMKAGYLLDNFGHPVQLPQIFNNFDIHSLFFSRGMCDTGNAYKELVFRSPDGSELAALNFNYSASFNIFANNHPRAHLPNYLPYYQTNYFTIELKQEIAQHIDHAGIAQQMIDGVKRNAPFYPSGIVPVFAGTDHCPPQSGLTKTLALANAMQDEIEFIFTDAGELSNALQPHKANMAVVTEDLIGQKYEHLLFGAMTTRMYLKQMMYACERQLFDYALPLAAYARYLGAESTQAILDEAAELLMMNASHDSIHGSSVEAVHKENEYRFDRAAQLTAHSIHDSMENISGHLCGDGETDAFTVFSPHAYDGYVSAWIYTDGNAVVITDKDGNTYESAPAVREEVICNANGKPYYQRAIEEPVREVCFRADLSAGEVKQFYYKKTDIAAREVTAVVSDCIENEYYALSAVNGHLYLTDRTAGKKAEDFLSFFEEADTGDTFDFSTPWKDAATYSSDTFGYTNVRVTDGGLYRKLCADCIMRVPAKTVGDDRSESMTDMPISLAFTLWNGIRRLDVDVTVANRCENHRVRAIFQMPTAFETVTANEIFCTEEFSVKRPERTANWAEEPTKELPFRDFVGVCDENYRYTIAAKGLYVFESPDNRRIAMTLFRSVGELMRNNLKNRAGSCAAGYPIPGAQCLRDMTFSFSLFTHAKEDSICAVTRDVQMFLTPPAAHTIRKTPAANENGDTFKPYAFRDNRNFVVSLFALSYDKKSYILRFYEINGETATAEIDLSAFGDVYVSDMNENRHEALTKENGTVKLDVPAHKIITLLLEK